MGSVNISGRDIDLPLVDQIGLVRSHSANRLSWHSHHGFELLFLLDGATSYEFQNGPVVEVPGGHFLVVTPGAVHRGVQEVRMPATICGIVLDSQPQNRCQHTPFRREDLEKIAASLKKSAMTAHPFNRELKRTLTQLADKKMQDRLATDPLARATWRSAVCATVLEAAHQLIVQSSPKQAEIAAAAAAYLRKRSHEHIRTTDLVRHTGFSRARLFQLFKASMGMTPNDYLQRVRVDKAKESLRTTKQPITEIALAAGFNSSQYFSTVFRRYTGITPGEYRIKYSNGRR